MLELLEPIRDQLVADIRAAWPEVTVVSIGVPRKPLSAPYAVLYLAEVPREFIAVRAVEEQYVFELAGRFSVSEDDEIESLKVQKAQALADRLLANLEYSGGGYMPQVLRVVFAGGEEDKDRFDVALTFSVRAAVTQ